MYRSTDTLLFALVLVLISSISNVSARPVESPQPPLARSLEGQGISLPLKSVPFVRKYDKTPRSISLSPSDSSSSTQTPIKRAYYNGVLSHLKEEFRNHSAQILEWTEEQKNQHQSKQPYKSAEEAGKGILSSILKGIGLPGGETKASNTSAGNATVVPNQAAVQGNVSFDAWPADIKTIVHPKGDASAGYSTLSLAVLEAQARVSGDLDQVKPSDGGIASQSTSYGVYSVDIGYVADVMVGTPEKAYSMLIDTGSADTWIGSKDCQTCRVTLSADDSSSFKETNEQFSITYGLGSASMTAATDHFAIAGMRVDDFAFGSAHTVSQQFTDPSVPFVGILGTAKGTLTAQKTKTLPERLMDTGVISNAVVAYALGRIADGQNTGQLTIGGYDSAMMNSATTQVLNLADDSGFWKVKMGAVMVDDKVAVSDDRIVILDTGTTLMYLPPADADAIHLLIEGAAPDGKGGYTVPCTMSEVIYLQFGSVAFSLDSRDITFLPVDPNDLQAPCTSSISSSAIDDRGTWLIGDPFLKNVYIVTDSGNNQVHLSGREGTQTTTRGA